jgi:hypothetical protein
MAKTDPATEIGARILHHLSQRRDHGGDRYPMPLHILLREAVPQAENALILKALAKAPLKGKIVIGVKFQPASPVALSDDESLQRLAESPELLRVALMAATDAGPPPFGATALAKFVATSLKKPFKAAFDQWLKAGHLPEGIEAIQVKRTKALFLRDHPPKIVASADRLLAALQHAKATGAYPATVESLIRSLDEDHSALGVDAMNLPRFRDRVTVIGSGSTAIVALSEDRESVAGSGTFLESLLRAARNDLQQAFAAKDLVPAKLKLDKPTKEAFVSAWTSAAIDSRLPATVGYVLIKGNRHYFLLNDLHASRPPIPQPVPVSASVSSFAGRFKEAFERLDRRRGHLNLVSLVDLRHELADVPREAFDAGVLQLRRERLFSLSSAEGLDGLRPDEREAAIRDEGDLLLNVSRISR